MLFYSSTWHRNLAKKCVETYIVKGRGRRKKNQNSRSGSSTIADFGSLEISNCVWPASRLRLFCFSKFARCNMNTNVISFFELSYNERTLVFVQINWVCDNKLHNIKSSGFCVQKLQFYISLYSENIMQYHFTVL